LTAGGQRLHSGSPQPFRGTSLRLLLPVLLWLLLVSAGSATAALQVAVEWDRVPLAGRVVEARLVVTDEAAQPVAGELFVLRPEGSWVDGAEGTPLPVLQLRSDEEGRLALPPLRIVEGDGSFVLERDERGSDTGAARLRSVPAWTTLVPPLLAIALALWLRQVFLALFAGVLGGAWLLHGNLGAAYLASLSDYVVGALTDDFQAAILLFTAALGGMVGVMARAGGTHGVVEAAQRLIRGPRSAQVMTAVMGLLIFFDDYANTLLVGNTMRPVTDRLRISREKLSYLVDSTAAPVTTVAVFSTWVGYQVGLIGDGLASVGRASTEAYSTFLGSIPYSTYSWFAMALVFWVVVLGRDFGPMLRAERRARRDGTVNRPGAKPLVDDVGKDLAPPGDKPRRASLAVAPILVVLLGTAAALRASEGVDALADHGLRDILSSADPAAALLWAAILGCAVAIGLAVATRTLDLGQSMDAWISGAKAMLPSLVILLLAWSIGDVCERLGTAHVVVGWATGNLAANLVPTVTFLVAAFLGFSTGTSWGTMAILMPIVIPLAVELPAAAGLDPGAAQTILLASVASVLSGSVLGDHCSPISDTTIMSSLASGADHVDHVRTQFPYALAAGLLAILLGTLPAGFGWPAWVGLPLGFVALGTGLRFWGRRPEAA